MSRPTSDRPTQHEKLADLPENDRHRLLASERRRLALSVLSERSSPVALEELADEIARRERDLDENDAESVRRVRTTLHHVHLPKLADRDFLQYDTRSNWIVP
jgi:hypothetical protein